MTVFVDTSIWYASVVVRDRQNARARAILNGAADLVTTDHVVVETCLLLTSRFRLEIAERFWEGIRRGAATLEMTSAADLEMAWAIGRIYSDQQFSIVDRTSFAVMERLGIAQAASFDHHFAIYRYGRNRDRAFEVLR